MSGKNKENIQEGPAPSVSNDPKKIPQSKNLKKTPEVQRGNKRAPQDQNQNQEPASGGSKNPEKVPDELTTRTPPHAETRPVEDVNAQEKQADTKMPI